MFFRFRTALLAVGLLFAVLPPACHAGTPHWRSWGGSSEIVLPFQNVQGEMVVTMSLNGHKGMNFVVDTGTGFTILDASAAAAAHVKILPLEAPPLQALAGPVPLTQTAPHARITGYGLELRDHLLVSNLQELQKGLGIPLAGIIGFDFLGQLPFLVDYSAKTITIFPPKRKNDTPHQGIEVSVEPSIPKEFDGPIVCLNLELPDGRRVKANLTVDTGSTEGLLLHVPFVEKYGLQPSVKAQTVSQTTYGGTYNATPGAVPALLLGDLRVEDLHALYAVNPVGMAGNKRIDGEIGFQILSRFRIFMDAPHHVVVFEPVSQK